MSDPTDEHAYGHAADEPVSAVGDDVAEQVESGELARLERKARDIELLGEAYCWGTDSWQFKELQRELIKYALPVLRAWISTGTVFVKVSELLKRRGGSFAATPHELERLRRDAELRDDLVNDTLVRGIERFQAQVNSRSGWDPDKGADLRTFFVNACLFEFLAVFRSYRRTLDQPARFDDVNGIDDEHSMVMPPVRFPATDLIVDVEAADQLWAELSLREQQIVSAIDSGHNSIEIAEIYGTTPGAVRAALQRLRNRMPMLFERRKLEEDQ